MEKGQIIAFLFAHPDDEAIPFGLPAELAGKKHDVHLIALTDGSLGSHTIRSRRKVARLRKKEFHNAATILDSTEHILGIQDGQLDASLARQRRRVLTRLREINPDILIIPNHNDYHEDHREAHKLALWATFHLPDGPIKTRRAFKTIVPTNKQVAVYEADTQGSQTWLSTSEDTGKTEDHLAPVNLILPVSLDAIERSTQAFRAHQSQLSNRDEGKTDYVALAILGAKRRGQQIGQENGVGLTFIPFGGYAFSTRNKLAELFHT